MEETDDRVVVKIDENETHFMIQKHHIKFIEVLTEKKVFKSELELDDEPKAELSVKKSDV